MLFRSALDPNNLDAHCRNSSLAGYKRPKAYLFVEDLPRNAANKILRRILRDQAIAALGGDSDNGVVYHQIGAS